MPSLPGARRQQHGDRPLPEAEHGVVAARRPLTQRGHAVRDHAQFAEQLVQPRQRAVEPGAFQELPGDIAMLALQPFDLAARFLHAAPSGKVGDPLQAVGAAAHGRRHQHDAVRQRSGRDSDGVVQKLRTGQRGAAELHYGHEFAGAFTPASAPASPVFR